MAAYDLGIAAWQMELCATCVHPHVGRACHDVRVTRQAEAHDVERGSELLIRHTRIDVFKADNVAEIFYGAVKLGHGSFFRSVFERHRENAIIRTLPDRAQDRAGIDRR